MSEDTIATSTSEIQGSYDDAPNVTQPIDTDSMPWLLRDKFKGETPEEQIRNQAMAYPELQKKMGEYFGAPKDSDYDLASLSEFGMTPEDPILVEMKSTFKEMGLSNAAVKKLAQSYDDSLKKMARGMEENLQKSMTPDLVQAAKRVEGWMGKFSKGEQETMKGWLQTPEDFKTLNTLIAMNPNAGVNNIPAQGSNYGLRLETSKSVEAEIIANHGKYKKDPAYRDSMTQRRREAMIREQKG